MFGPDTVYQHRLALTNLIGKGSNMATQTICKVEGCGNTGKITRGLCDMHYQRLRKNGDPLKVKVTRYKGAVCLVTECCNSAKIKGLCHLHYNRKRTTGSLDLTDSGPTRLEWMTQISSISQEGCLKWPFAVCPHGRGVLKFEGRMRSAPWVMCFLVHGSPPTEKHEAAHSCGNGHHGCLNPTHLRWSTRKENEMDKVMHGTLCRGSDINTSKLSCADVLDIRESASSGVVLAKRYGVSTAAISAVRTRKTWRHV